MSTRSTTHFKSSSTAKPEAIIYRHSDGYPEGAGVDLLRFLIRCSKLKDSRLDDSTYLAAKYVVFLAEMFHDSHNELVEKLGYPDQSYGDDRLAFLSVGVMQQDPGDIEYRYEVICGRPGQIEVWCDDLSGKRKPLLKCLKKSDIPKDVYEASVALLGSSTATTRTKSGRPDFVVGA